VHSYVPKTSNSYHHQQAAPARASDPGVPAAPQLAFFSAAETAGARACTAASSARRRSSSGGWLWWYSENRGSTFCELRLVASSRSSAPRSSAPCPSPAANLRAQPGLAHGT